MAPKSRQQPRPISDRGDGDSQSLAGGSVVGGSSANSNLGAGSAFQTVGGAARVGSSSGNMFCCKKCKQNKPISEPALCDESAFVDREILRVSSPLSIRCVDMMPAY